MAAETGFMIDGREYEIPTIDTFTLDEAQILYDYAGLTLEDFMTDETADVVGVDAKLKNPGFIRALLHVAYQRGNPHANPARVRALAGAANLVMTLARFDDSEEGEDRPPAPTTEPNESSPKSSVDSNQNSGSPSADDSGGQVVQLAPTTDGSSPHSESTPTVSAG